MIHEMIERNDKEEQALKNWEWSDRRKLLHQNIRSFLQDPESEFSSFQIFQNGHSHSFVLFYENSGMYEMEMQCYFDYLKNQVLEQDYTLYMSDRKIKTEPKNIVKTIERHYLKPKNKRLQKNEKAEQKYGNISIEYHLRDEKPEFVKFSAAYYSDRLYHDVESFPELLDKIFD